MPFSKQDTELYRQDVKLRGNALSASEREALLKKYLPTPTRPTRPASRASRPDKPAGRKRRIRPWIKSKVYFSLHLIIQFIFGIYMRLRQIKNAIIHKFLSIRHYHHRTPAYIKKDTQSLSRLPEHLSILLKYDPTDEDPAALETLIDEVAELSAWSAAAGIPLLSIYEKSGVLKSYMSAVQELVHQKLVQYFGAAPLTPVLQVHAPNLPTLAPTPFEPETTTTTSEYTYGDTDNGDHHHISTPVPGLSLLLLSASDGRDTLVDLTRTLTEMAQSSKIRPKDINSSLINMEINATTAIPSPSDEMSSAYFPCPSRPDLTTTTNKDTRESQTTTGTKTRQPPPSEPDLLIVFGPYVRLDGYPPWQVRLTEIYCVGDSGGDVSRGVSGRSRVEYQGFLRGLWKYAGAEMRFGK